MDTDTTFDGRPEYERRLAVMTPRDRVAFRLDRIEHSDSVLVPKEDLRALLGAESTADFCRWLLTLDDPDNPQGMEDRRTIRLSAIIDRARKALGED